MDVERRGQRGRGEPWSTVVGHSEGRPVGFVCMCVRVRRRDCHKKISHNIGGRH